MVSSPGITSGLAALGLGIGAAVAHSPGTAAADSSTGWLSSTGVPDNEYPTEIYDIYGDSYALPGTAGTTSQSLTFGAEEHDTYLGLTPSEIALGTPTPEGTTTLYVIPELTSGELYTALLAAGPAGTGSAGAQ